MSQIFKPFMEVANNCSSSGRESLTLFLQSTYSFHISRSAARLTSPNKCEVATIGLPPLNSGQRFLNTSTSTPSSIACCKVYSIIKVSLDTSPTYHHLQSQA